MAVVVGLCGLCPHIWWSWENQGINWFHNSFDEGFYAWSALSDFVANRWLSSFVLRLLYNLCGTNTQWMMIASDFILPAGAVVAASYLVRPLCSQCLSMGIGALIIISSAELLGMRTNLLLDYMWFNDLQAWLLSVGGGPGGLFLLGNLTSAFWIFRTPEPGISWILMFVVLGLGLRIVLDPVANLRREGSFYLACLLLGLGYMFCALSVGGAFLLYAALAYRSHRRLAYVIGGGGVINVASCLGLSLLGTTTGASFVFPSRQPAMMICFFACLVAIGLTLIRLLLRRTRAEAGHLFALALALTPFVMSNQQLVTGKMIYLHNFENFGLAHLAALALLLAGGTHPTLWPATVSSREQSRPARWFAHASRILAIALLIGILLHAQRLSFEQWKPPNQVARSYALAIDSVPAGEAQIICSDFIATGIQPLLLNRRPNFLLTLDDTYLKPISRLQNPATRPANAALLETSLFTYLAATGVSPPDLKERLKAVSDPGHPNWEDRTLLGGYLYSYADFWTPLTHSRDVKLGWITEQNNLIVQNYARFLDRGAVTSTTLLLFQPVDRPVSAPPEGWQVDEVASHLGSSSLPLKVLRLRRPTRL